MASHQIFVRLAPLLFVSLWSTGFVAAKYSMMNADPFVFLCLRFTLTALTLVPILFLLRQELPRSLSLHRHDMIAGLMIQCGYLGFVFWPIQNGVPSGIVAIIIGLQPLLTMGLAAIFIGEPLGLKKASGFIIGFFGVVIVITGKFGIDLAKDGGISVFNLGLCLVGLLSIAVGVFYQKKFCDRSRLLAGTLMQYIAAAVAAALLALLLQEKWTIEWTSGFALALSWQVLGLSIGAVVLLMSIIRLGEAGRVSSMFYLVPPLVVIEAHFLFGEVLGVVSIFGMLLCGIGVYLVNRQPNT